LRRLAPEPVLRVAEPPAVACGSVWGWRCDLVARGFNKTTATNRNSTNRYSRCSARALKRAESGVLVP